MCTDPDEPAARPVLTAPAWRAAIRGSDADFEAPADTTLLASAEAAGLPLASSCRVGTCRTCMRRLVSGGVLYRMEWPGLLAEEKAEGWILPCGAYPASDVVLE